MKVSLSYVGFNSLFCDLLTFIEDAMTKITPEQLREVIEAIRVRQLQITHQLEQYEAIIQNAPPYLLPKMQADVEELHKMNRVANNQTRKYAKLLEQVLAEDEAANGWKGEDRYIEIGEDNDDDE